MFAMKERILEFLKAENKTSAQLAEDIGVQPSGISHILSGRNNPSLDFVIRMLEKYHFLSTDWLLFGKGSMYKETGMQNLFQESTDFGEREAINKPDEPKNQGIRDIPLHDHELRTESMADVEKIVFFFKDKSFTEYSPAGK